MNLRRWTSAKYRGRKPAARTKAAEVLRLWCEGPQRTEIARRLDIGVASVYRIMVDANGSGDREVAAGHRPVHIQIDDQKQGDTSDDYHGEATAHRRQCGCSSDLVTVPENTEPKTQRRPVLIYCGLFLTCGLTSVAGPPELPTRLGRGGNWHG